MRVIIMCKAPVAGSVKTRLMTKYSAEEAAEIHRKMAKTVIFRAERLFNDVKIAVNDKKHPFFDVFSNIPMLAQGEGDLGERMRRLLLQESQNAPQAILFLGTDSPHMTEDRLLQVEQQLRCHDVVIGPVEDGGYDLIAMAQPYPQLFQNIHWGTEHVTCQTLEKIKESGLSYFLLDESFDIDTPEDLERIEHL